MKSFRGQEAHEAKLSAVSEAPLGACGSLEQEECPIKCLTHD